MTPTDRFSKIFGHVMESLQTLESFVKIPATEERRKLTNEKILSQLRKLGVATQGEVDELKAQIVSLEDQVTSLKQKQKETH